MRADPKPASAWRETAARLSCIHRANVVDTSHGEIKANRVPAFARRPRHTTPFSSAWENRYANLRANPSNLALPALQPLRDGSCARHPARRRYPFPAPFAHTIYPPKLLSPHSLRLSLSLSRAHIVFSLSFCLRDAIVFSERRTRVRSLSLGVQCRPPRGWLATREGRGQGAATVGDG